MTAVAPTRLELFHAAGCAACDAARGALKAAALEEDADLGWRDVDVLDELDHAVELGVLTLPAIAIDGHKTDAPNAFGINGLSDAFFNQFSTETESGNGQHGGLGRYEQNPFMIITGGGFAPGSATDTPTSAVDIAPTILGHLGLPSHGMDGKSLLK